MANYIQQSKFVRLNRILISTMDKYLIAHGLIGSSVTASYERAKDTLEYKYNAYLSSKDIMAYATSIESGFYKLFWDSIDFSWLPQAAQDDLNNKASDLVGQAWVVLGINPMANFGGVP